MRLCVAYLRARPRRGRGPTVRARTADTPAPPQPSARYSRRTTCRSPSPAAAVPRRSLRRAALALPPRAGRWCRAANGCHGDDEAPRGLWRAQLSTLGDLSCRAAAAHALARQLLARRFPYGGAFDIRCPILNGTGLGPVAGGDLALPAGLVDDFDLPLLGTAGVSWPPA